MEIGYTDGDLCNRDGCKGIINKHDKEGSCSCHIHPPCGYCTKSAEYCPECEWEADDDEIEELSNDTKEYYRKSYEENERKNKEFWDNFRSDKTFNKLEYRYESHTHFSMKKIGFFPIEMPISELVKNIRGTFGGRFLSLNEKKGRFSYIAYTD